MWAWPRESVCHLRSEIIIRDQNQRKPGPWPALAPLPPLVPCPSSSLWHKIIKLSAQHNLSMNNRTQWWIRRPGSGHKSSYNSGHQRESPVRTRNCLKHDYLCISVIIRSAQLSSSPSRALATRTRIRDNILSRCCELRERWGKIENDKNLRQRDWSKTDTSAQVGSIIDATSESPHF